MNPHDKFILKKLPASYSKFESMKQKCIKKGFGLFIRFFVTLTGSKKNIKNRPFAQLVWQKYYITKLAVNFSQFVIWISTTYVDMYVCMFVTRNSRPA